MNTRHPRNQNLSLHYDSAWNGFPVYASYDRPLVNEYLSRIHEVICHSIRQYPRSFVIRFELRFPHYWPEQDTGVISRFFESLTAKIEADLNRRARSGKRVHWTRVRYVWVKERDSAIHWHYHVAILVNRDTYFTLGTIREDDSDIWVDVPKDPCVRDSISMADRIIEAFASALRCDPNLVRGVVHFTQDGCYSIDANSAEYCDQFCTTFLRLSYLAKAATKDYGDGSNWFGCSRG